MVCAEIVGGGWERKVDGRSGIHCLRAPEYTLLLLAFLEWLGRRSRLDGIHRHSRA